MGASTRVLIVVAASALIGAGLLVSQAFRASPPPVPAIPPPAPPVLSSAVLVAGTDLPAGKFLEEDDLVWHDRPNTALRPDFFVKGSDVSAALVGAMLTRAVRTGEPILRNDALLPRDRGFLAAKLTPDKRSVSVAVDEVSGNAGLIQPGDHVDVIVTRTLAPTEPPARQVVGEMVAENLRVIAVDQALRAETEQGPAETAKQEAHAAPAAGANAAPRHATARTVTLEVTPRQAELLVVAAALGKLTLALRSITERFSDSPAAKPSGAAVWAGDVMHSLVLLSPRASPHAEPTAQVVVLRGVTAKQPK